MFYNFHGTSVMKSAITQNEFQCRRFMKFFGVDVSRTMNDASVKSMNKVK